jgi:hypothetical protein
MTEMLIREYFEASQQNAAERRQLVFINILFERQPEYSRS